jgi:hypothetical protein
MLTGSEGAGIGVGGTFLILFIGVGIWYFIYRTKKQRTLKKTQSSTSTTSPATNTATNTTTQDTYNAASALEMGTAEGNTHELPAPDKLHEMGDLAPEYTEGDGMPLEEVSPETPHQPGYTDEKGISPRDEKSAGATGPAAELEGDVAFPDGQNPAEGGPGKEGVGKGFVLTD